MQKTKTKEELLARKRKMHLRLPMLALPLLVLVFYWMGGGKGVKEATGSDVRGINMQLPPSQEATKGKPADKMTAYEQAASDSAKLAEKRKQDPYGTNSVGDSARRWAVPAVPGVSGLSGPRTDGRAEELLRRIGEMKKELVTPGAGFKQEGQRFLQARPQTLEALDVIGSTHRDPEMERLDGLLDKLLRVQHPELVKKDSGWRVEPALAVAVAADEEDEDGGFMEITDAAADSVRGSGISAVVNVDQTLTAGSTVEFRLTHAVTVDGHRVPKDQLLHGVASLSGERLMVVINSIRVGMAIWPVALQVYDLDGLAGIRVPGAMGRDVSKESADEALNGLSLAAVDPSLGEQAASAGLQFARSLAGKKVRLIRVGVPAGYRVLLRNIKR